MKKLGLYIHIPFCKKKCKYCIFYSMENNNDYVIEQYIKLMIDQIIEYSLLTKNYHVDTIYFGGGSPSYIKYKHIELILNTIYKNFNINKEKLEITLECNPEDLNSNYIDFLYNSTINRISIGIQSVLNDELKLLNRNYNIYDINKIINLLKKNNINNISVDLIYGLPYQTLSKIMLSINTIISLDINHISIYNFEIHNKYFQKMKYSNEELQFEMYKHICNKLIQKNFFKYEISNFSKKNFESEHNKKYWNLKDYIGIGSGAHSFFQNKRFSNNTNLYNFNKIIIYDNYNIKPFEDYILLKIRTQEGINLNYIEKNFDFKIDINKINFLINQKLLYKNRNNYILTYSGSFLINKVIYELLT